MGSIDKEKFFIALDLGTTSTRAHVIDKKFSVLGGARFESTLIQNDEGTAELDPEEYFANIVRILREAVSSAGIDASQLISLGISCQRSTFITWDSETGETFHNLITWKDRRAVSTVEKVNNSLLLKCVNSGSRVMYALTRQELFRTTSKLKIGNTWLNHRLEHFIKNNEKLKRAIKLNRARYGLLDSWLLNRLKMDHTNHISDISASAATGIFDVFKLDFATPMLVYFGISRTLLPKVVSNFHDFGLSHESIFGIPVEISCVITDQSASLVANCCFNPWQSKITLGTGSFLHVNVGEKCQGSDYGANPLVAWSIRNSFQKPTTVFKLEFFHESSSEAIRFMQTVGLCSDVGLLSDLAYAVEDSDGVFFIPEFFGFFGIKQTTTNLHLVRAVLENIIFTICHYYFMQRNDPNYKPRKIRIDGGIAQNDFVCQQISNLTGVSIERSKDCSELTSIGCAILSAYKYGFIKSLEEAEQHYRSEKIFVPEPATRPKLLKEYQKYLKVVRKL